MSVMPAIYDLIITLIDLKEMIDNFMRAENTPSVYFNFDESNLVLVYHNLEKLKIC